jgi:catechol 2,3-dioxygenase-like lactoylglutathione lyase family enzyme
VIRDAVHLHRHKGSRSQTIVDILHESDATEEGVSWKDSRSRQRLELNYYPPRAKYHERFRSGSELDHLAFWERDVDGKYEEMLANGATKAVEPFSEGGYRLAFVKDPDGIWIELLGKERRARRRVS